MTDTAQSRLARANEERQAELAEVRLLRLAPISQEMVLNFISQKVLGLPRSY